MRLIVTGLSLALLSASPAFAGDARIEVRTGLGWSDGRAANATLGGAVGYDMGFGPAFVGIEQSVDKVLARNRNERWGTSGRIGTTMIPGTRIYASAGYNYGAGPNATSLGAGLEQKFGPSPVYGKVEYKRYFNEDQAPNSNAAMVGLGLRF
jgi:outer membrane immunogenic protein